MPRNTIFFPPKSKRLANTISLESPQAASESVRLIERGGVSTEELRAMNLAANRAHASLNRKNLSLKERIELAQVSDIYRNAVDRNKKKGNPMNDVTRLFTG